MQMTVKPLFRILQFLFLIVSLCATYHTVPLFFSGSFRMYIVEEPVQKRAIEMLRCFIFIQFSLNFSIIFTVNSYLVGVLIFGVSLYKM